MAVICRSPRTAIAARATIPPRRCGRSPRRAPRQPGPGSSRGRSRRVRHARRARADPANPPATAAATREPSTALAVTHAEPVSPAPTHRAHRDGAPAASRGHRGADGGADRVGRHQVLRVHHPREGGGEAGEDEPADPGDQQRPEVERGTGHPGAHRAATAAINAARNRFATTSTWRRSHRSSNAPAKGSTSEYGSSSTASPSATAAGSAWRSGLNSTALPRPAWKAPSPTGPRSGTRAAAGTPAGQQPPHARWGRNGAGKFTAGEAGQG